MRYISWLGLVVNDRSVAREGDREDVMYLMYLVNLMNLMNLLYLYLYLHL